MTILIEVLGWIASVLIVGSYFLNIRGKLDVQSKWYILANMVGGLFFVINTWYHGAYPSMAVNVVWVIIAAFALNRLGRLKKERGQPSPIARTPTP